MIDLEAIEKKREAATPPPWKSKIEYFRNELDKVQVYADGKDWGLVVEAVASRANEERSKANIRFIAHARQDIPDLIAEVRGLREGIKAYQALCVCYRLGHRPSEAMFARMEKARKLLEEP